MMKRQLSLNTPALSKPWTFALIIGASVLILWSLLPSDSASPRSSLFGHASNRAKWSFNVAQDARNLGLTDAQCDAAFPDLFQELERAKDWHRANKPGGLITEADVDQYEGRAQLRLMIYEGQLRILDTWGIEGPHIPDRPIATLQAIHRAIVSIPDPSTIPNIEFTIDTQDDGRNGGPRGTMWIYCRENTPSGDGSWIMPDFGFWSYPSDSVGSYDEFRSKVKLVEASEAKYSDKIDRLVWRGQASNGGDVRNALVEASKGKPWSDVSFLSWENKDTIVDMHDHCKYKFTAHTEGVTWSGRLRYLQNCNNVVLTHKLDYAAHYYHLLVPSGPFQNIVEVQRDYSDLDEKMNELITNPKQAERIAAENARVFRDRYLTPAAEACYWRRMFRTWKEVQGFEPRIWTDGREGEEGPRRWRGRAWERYSATGTNWGEDAHP